MLLATIALHYFEHTPNVLARASKLKHITSKHSKQRLRNCQSEICAALLSSQFNKYVRCKAVHDITEASARVSSVSNITPSLRSMSFLLATWVVLP